MVDPAVQMPAGPAADAQGRTVIDPTDNVRALLVFAADRQDSLRTAEARYQNALRMAESSHVREVIAIRVEHSSELRRAESERLNAIREVDVRAVAANTAVAETRAGTLAAQVATSAETLRGQVAAAATAQTVALKAETDPFRKDIAELRQVQYETAGGKQQVVEGRATGGSIGLWIGLAVAGVSLVIGFGSLILGVAAILITILLKP